MTEKNESPQEAADKSDGNKHGRNIPKGSKKENMLDFTKQLVSLGALQQAIVRNLQREIENLET